LCNFLHFPVTSSLLGPHILLSTLFSNTLSLHTSSNSALEERWALLVFRAGWHVIRSSEYYTRHCWHLTFKAQW
jgi:hypothetical protein